MSFLVCAKDIGGCGYVGESREWVDGSQEDAELADPPLNCPKCNEEHSTTLTEKSAPLSNMDTTAVAKIMKSSTCECGWNKNCDIVKAAFGGNYPGFWFDIIIQSGLQARVASNWQP